MGLMQGLRGLRDLILDVRSRDGVTAVALGLVILFSLVVSLAAVFPAGGGDTEDLGRWRGPMNAEEAVRAVLVVYSPEDGSLQLQLDPNEEALTASRSMGRFIKAHMQKFNRHVRGRAFKRAGLVQGPPDCLFAVSLEQRERKALQARLVPCDLNRYDMHPVGERELKNLGPVHFAPSAVKQPYFSDGDLGFFLDPRVAADAFSRPVSLLDSGIYNAGAVLLSDREGNARARVQAVPDGSAVEVTPLGSYGVFLENNPPVDGAPVRVTEGQVAEIGGRFFEAHITEAATLAATREKGGSIKRIYPMGKLFHIVGPLSLDGGRQSLGIEYMFQEYLMGLPRDGIAAGELWLTLDERLQATLAAHVTDMAGMSKQGVAGALLMNAQTGAVLAMAATPDGYEPENEAEVMDLLARGREGRYNHGCFRRHVIGSVTKAFYAFMALQVMGDDVRQLVLDTPAPETATLWGHRLYGGRDHAMKIKHDGVDFDSYLIRSDNNYQHALGLLLLAGVRDPSNELSAPWLSRGHDGRPHLRPIAAGDPLKVGTLGGVRDRMRVDISATFAAQYREIFDIETVGGADVPDDRDISLYGEPFLELASRILQTRYPGLEQPRVVLKRRSVVCAPEAPRTELDEVRTTMDASNILYGANRNRWTDVKLAEAFSRMMTGKRIQARLVSRYRDTLTGELVDLEAAAAEAAPLTVPNPGAFAEMRRILSRVPMRAGGGYPEGTAHALQPVVARMAKAVPGFSLVGKTGTIDDGQKGDPDSRLFLGTFGVQTAEGFSDQAYTVVIYLKNAADPDAPFDFLNKQLPLWWELLNETPAAPVSSNL